MLSLRHLLLAVLLFAAQWAANLHAMEHALGEAEGMPPHACEWCLAAHDLGDALPGVATPLAAPAVFAPPLPPVLFGRTALRPPEVRQGAPPAA